jgi:xylan 1,4-beta-xylosidase
MRTIAVDTHAIKGNHIKAFRKCVGSGRAQEGLFAEHQRQLAIAAKECGFQYLRCHGLLCDDMRVYWVDDDGQPQYNWQYIDLVYDYILKIGMKPFVELSFMPAALASGPETIFWWKGNVTPPNSYEKWEELIYRLVTHFTQRYGEEEVEQWYFEVWNEPNLSGFFTGTMDEYFKLYQVTVRAIKGVNSRYRVGGPATAGIGWIEEFIDFCVKNSVPIDFISTHTYGVIGHLDEFGKQRLYLDPNPDSVTADVRKVYEQVKASKLPDLEIHFTEWSTSYSPRDPVHDAYHSAAFILDKLKACESYADSMSYWVFTDIFEEPGPPSSHFHGGFGLMNTQGLKKPAYFAYSFLNQLGDVELNCADNRAWACKSDNGVQVLLWDYTHAQQDAPNQVYYTRDLPSVSLDPVTLRITGLDAGIYTLTVSTVGYRQNDVYTRFLEMDCQGTLTPEQVEALAAECSGKPAITETIHVEAGCDFVRSFPMRTCDVLLVRLDKVDGR